MVYSHVVSNNQTEIKMKTQSTITASRIVLRNKITGLFYADGNCFNSTTGTVIEKDSPQHAAIRYTFDMTNVEEIPAGDMLPKPRRTGGLRKTAKYEMGNWEIVVFKRTDWLSHIARNTLTRYETAQKSGGIMEAERFIREFESTRSFKSAGE